MRNNIGNRAANKARWQERVKQANRHPEGLTAYCRAHNVSLGALKYWRKKDQAKPPVPAFVQQRRPAFIPIQVMETENEIQSQRLPDSKWVADLILHLSAGVSRSRR